MKCMGEGWPSKGLNGSSGIFLWPRIVAVMALRQLTVIISESALLVDEKLDDAPLKDC